MALMAQGIGTRRQLGAWLRTERVVGALGFGATGPSGRHGLTHRAGGGRWQLHSLPLQGLDLLDDQRAQLLVGFLLRGPVADSPPREKIGAVPDVQTVGLLPADELEIAILGFHLRASRSATNWRIFRGTPVTLPRMRCGCQLQVGTSTRRSSSHGVKHRHLTLFARAVYGADAEAAALPRARFMESNPRGLRPVREGSNWPVVRLCANVRATCSGGSIDRCFSGAGFQPVGEHGSFGLAMWTLVTAPTPLCVGVDPV